MQKDEIIKRAKLQKKLGEYDEAEQALVGRGFLVAYNIAWIVWGIKIILVPFDGDIKEPWLVSANAIVNNMLTGIWIVGLVTFWISFFRTKNRRLLADAILCTFFAITDFIMLLI